jgi:hypothetical protein
MQELEMPTCPSCSYENHAGAARCERCGKRLAHPHQPPPPETAGEGEVPPGEEGGDVIPAAKRVSLGEFGGAMGADLAAGFLRGQGIAAEVGAEMYPGVWVREVWVRREDAATARRLLAEVDPNAEGAGSEER